MRDQKRLAEELHIGEPDAAWLLELAFAAGLLDVGGPHRDEWLPTRSLRRLAGAGPRRPVGGAGRGWLAGVRLPSLVGQRDVAGKAVNALSPDLVRHTAPAIRRSALAVLAEYPAGSGLAAHDLVALLRWRTPRRADRLAPVPACWPRPSGWASWSAACCPRAGAACWPAGRTARPTGCAACCPSRSTTCSPSPTCR